MGSIKYLQDSSGKAYYFDALRVNGHTVLKDVGADAKLTDTTYNILSSNSSYTTADNKGLVVPLPASGQRTSDYILAANGSWRQRSSLQINSSFIKNASANAKTIIIGDDNSNNTATSAANYSFVTGFNNEATASNQFVMGQYSDASAEDIFIIGNGTSTEAKSNCFVIKKDGHIEFDTSSTIITTFMNS